MGSLRDFKSSNLPCVTGIGFLLFEWEVAWRNFEVHSLKKLANRIHVSTFSILFFSKKNYRLLSYVTSVRPSVRLSVVYGKYFIVALILFLYWSIDLKFGLNIGCRVVHVRKASFLYDSNCNLQIYATYNILANRFVHTRIGVFIRCTIMHV